MSGPFKARARSPIASPSASARTTPPTARQKAAQARAAGTAESGTGTRSVPKAGRDIAGKLAGSRASVKLGSRGRPPARLGRLAAAWTGFGGAHPSLP